MATSTNLTDSLETDDVTTGNLLEMMAERPLPKIPSDGFGTISDNEATEKVISVLATVNDCLEANDAESLSKCFYQEQAYWRDQLALTWHLRTFGAAATIAAGLLETTKLRRVDDGLIIKGPARLIHATPLLQFIDCAISFSTNSPPSSCTGNLRLLPLRNKGENGDESICWKIWILNTWVQDLAIQPEDKSLLESSQRDISSLEQFETDVFIIGAGNAAVSLAARLKALGVESVMAERNKNIGDNWTLRYDCLRFHVPTSFCELPYMLYDKDLQSPHHLSKDELGAQIQRYAAAFNLNIITSAKILSTSFDLVRQHWSISLDTPNGQRLVTCKHLVQATGFASQVPYVPAISNTALYQGVVLHSAKYTNSKQLLNEGVKSVLVIGSANTAFDIMEDCYAAGLQTTMVARSPTYVCPVEYICDTHCLGIYDPLGFEAADNLLMTGPVAVDAAMVSGLLAQMASEEPDRYDSLAKAGFPVFDSRDPQAVLMSNLLERAGGHYIDIGGTKLLAEGKVTVKGGVEPIAFTPTGVLFSDNTRIDADAVVWCTGFRDKNAQSTAAEILGANAMTVNSNLDPKHILGPQDIAARLDPTWGLDTEGEVRGMWKRHVRIDNYWTMGGYTQQHRWHSRTLALQIKAALEGVLPSAYRKTPMTNY